MAESAVKAAREAPLGRRFLTTVVLAAIIPLGALGWWNVNSAAKSGADLLRTHLDGQLSQLAEDVGRRWEQRRADILLLTENEPVRLALVKEVEAGKSEPVPPFVLRAFAQMSGLNHLVIRDRSGRIRWTLEAPPLGEGQRQSGTITRDIRGIPVHLPITDLQNGDTIGSVDATLRAVMLLPIPVGAPPPGGPLTAVFIPGGGSIVSPLVDQRLFNSDQVRWSGSRWLTVRRHLTEPPIEIAVAGALDPYAIVFEHTARVAAATFVIAALAIAALLVTITRQTTLAVERTLAQREALAAVGEFASELAHEIRNPLTAIRLDLQRMDEVAESPMVVRTSATRVLRQIDRLDRAVTGALRVSRAGSGQQRRVLLGDVVQHARQAAEPEFAHRQASLNVPAIPPIELDGDAEALEQVFLNLLINAAHALGTGGTATLVVVARVDSVEIRLSDDGTGMTTEELVAANRPYRSSKHDGTGLGLKIARRIVANHRGDLALQSTVGVGTTVRVTLPTRRS